MKNVKLLCLGLLIAGSANAQYFQHLYGSTRSEHLQSGVNAIATAAQGHIMTGYTDVTGMNTLMVTSADLNGNIPVGYFNNRYVITEPNQPALDVKGRRVVQFAGNRIGVWGDYAYGAGNLSTRFFYTLLAPNGVPGPTVSFQLPFPVVEVHATSMCVSRSAATANNVYVCGWERQSAAGPRVPVIMCLNWGTGAIVWSWQYQVANISAGTDWVPTDLVESPYIPASGSTDIALTGSFLQPSGFLTGCYFTVDAFTGINTSPIFTYGSPNAIQSFNAIEIANNPFGSGPGFVMAGTSNFAGTDDSWAMKIDPTGFIVNFSTLQNYNPSDRNYGYDIIERRNTSGRFEYYVCGYTNFGHRGQNDDVVFKLDASGLPITSGLFTYGGPGNEQAFQLDQYNGYGPQNDGLSIYGNTDGGSWPMIGGPDFYLVKSYFNGVTACNWDTISFDSLYGPGLYETWQPTNPNKLKRVTLNNSAVSMSDWQICWAQPVIGGSNARMAQTVENQILEPGYFPNPVSLDNPIINVTFGNVATQGEAEIELWNSLGQLVWTKKSALADGQTQMQVDLGNQLSGGIYQLVIRQNGTINNYRIVVK